MTHNDVVQTRSGPVRGTVGDGVRSFLGIPYAASPAGKFRFAAPQPPEPWTEVLPADRFGPTPPKAPYPAPLDVILREVEVPGDDWLTVNVWTPEHVDVPLPVLVWIHGGAFVNGNAAIPTYGGGPFARDGVVMVSLNYRLGVEGFALLADATAPANRGILDQIAALEWVRDNIAAFGGDPANVTICGESAGAMSVITLLTSPRAAGLFARAIAQSGTVQGAVAPEDAALVTAAVAEVLGIEPTAAAFADVAPEAVIAAQRAVVADVAATRDATRYGPTVIASGMTLPPVIDGEVVPIHPMAAIAGGAGADVPLLTGSNRDEYRLFLVPTGVAAAMTEEGLAGFTAAAGIPGPVLSRYRANRPDAHPGDVLCALLGDAFFRLPAFAVADARLASSAGTWVYEFAWPTPVADLGACHAVEIGFVFDNLAATGNDELAGADAPQSLADVMHAAWVAFARHGDPGWERHDSSRPVMVFDGDGASLAHDLRADERTIWVVG
ncbi:MAG TPA: carboxylesterase family protein [Micromonosporaceae bacterium]